MKTSLFAFLLAVTTCAAALAQSDAASTSSLARPIKLSFIRIYPLTGQHIDGVFYALTDSAVVYFARTETAINAVKQGNVPALDTLPARQISRFSLKREGHYLRATAVAVGIGGALFALSYLQADPFVRIFLHIAAFPTLLLSPLIGLVPELTVTVRGRPGWMMRKRKRLNRYTVETQRQRLRAEPAW